jgi:4-phospho-D-threonate 3-dehydrogenase / 4-phospho-D-erythronate 3-dehydrogenase
MRQILIIADDLSGAADCAMACACTGLNTVVSLGNAESGTDAEVLAIDADTRSLDPAAAANKVSALMRRYCSGIQQIVFKKIDSALRGNVAEELAAVLKTQRELHPQSGPLITVLAPAFPARGRTTLKGRQLLDGRYLEETEIWRREGKRGSSHIPEMLASAGLRSALIGLETIRSSNGDLRKAVVDLAVGSDVLVCDAETEGDLAAIAAAASSLGPQTVWAGSAGLAYCLPAALKLAPTDSANSRQQLAVGPTLFVIGSPSSNSREQAKALSASSNTIAIPSRDLRLGAGDAPWSKHDAAIANAFASGRDVVVTFGSEERIDVSKNKHLASALARMVAPYAGKVGALVLTGGETARAVLESWGIASLRPVKEVETGVPFSISENCSRSIPVITKAGDFGTPGTMLHCQQFLHDLKRNSPGTLYHEKRTMSERPIIAMTMGDAAGVGPEVIMKSLAHAELHEQCRPLVIGDAERLRAAGQIVGSALKINPFSVAELEKAIYVSGTVNCVDLKLIPKGLPWGKISAVAGHAAFRYMEVAATLAMSGKVDAICTAPLNKEALHAGGHKYPGHTEMLAALTGTQEVSMMLTTPKMRVLHVTTHIGLLDAIEKIEPGLVERTIVRGHEALVKAGIADPMIGVCGINPHAGENGLFGYGEEEQKIQPAIDACRKKGWRVEGPLPADTLFYRAQRGDFDLVIAMYHDQGHGPVKVLGLESGVNITVGLPVIRTSVDHGTAFDIAGTGRADERSMLEAVRQAVLLAGRK